ncbi:nascent polypeptide-associated complex subunit alpha, muscle-specific form-like isoform X3 [Hemicordylus capensis]|uniref:nascent polypeptide-associated complex subunit alpha, muscle-specific form-like isoform X3 n=1 Tax=Hemicordylus capensis TaxID=884348 RepID=UPI002302253A|nr:nascent polypeptide-associated complex subunit alpha, muscle-specific form-like isoform X3 [Hemicordylus capensis]XP_053126467.1 nascent polypeptide-associated complex subunit alpha, muscle-specific form-like isoform X3 [Hemicordylus capensis]
MADESTEKRPSAGSACTSASSAGEGGGSPSSFLETPTATIGSTSMWSSVSDLSLQSIEGRDSRDHRDPAEGDLRKPQREHQRPGSPAASPYHLPGPFFGPLAPSRPTAGPMAQFFGHPSFGQLRPPEPEEFPPFLHRVREAPGYRHATLAPIPPAETTSLAQLAPIPPAARTSLAQPARADPARKRNRVLLAHRLQSEGSSTTAAAGGFRPAPPDQPRSGKPTDIRRASRVLIPATEQTLAIQIKEPATQKAEGFSTGAARRMKIPELGPHRAGTQERHPPSPPQLQGRGLAKGGTAPPTGEIQLPNRKKLLVQKQELLPEFLFPPPPPEPTKVLAKGTASHLVAPGDKGTQCTKPRLQLFDFLPPISLAPKKTKDRTYGELLGRKLPAENNGKRARAAGAESVPAPKVPRGSPKAEGEARSGETAKAPLEQKEGRTAQKIPTCHLELAVQPHQPTKPAGSMPGQKLLRMPQVLPGRGKARLLPPEAKAGDTKRQKVGAESSGSAQAVPPTPRSSLARMMRDSVQVFHALGPPAKSKSAEGHPGQSVPQKTPAMSMGRPPSGSTAEPPPRPLAALPSRPAGKAPPSSMARPAAMPMANLPPSSLAHPQSTPVWRPPGSRPFMLRPSSLAQANSLRMHGLAGRTFGQPPPAPQPQPQPWGPTPTHRPVLPAHQASTEHPVLPPGPQRTTAEQEFKGDTFIPWRTPPAHLEVSRPMTEEQRPVRELMRRRAQRAREEAAQWTSAGRRQYFVEREEEMDISLQYGYPWRH